ncbi:DUF2252 domain-containing protein [Roseiconus nitratireducens]|uniref:DUF2252 domain-containing protein n=1 Tax=Roseiconus nitratireducens TaxID=2605748 RepID=A0A5M6DMD6_9BACT|nr:DUF2252 family protein [Roseiconus nitratireducens]KAA5547300.1 DUF2252 domain-containing protein [Roseiconus nitratireducens]
MTQRSTTEHRHPDQWQSLAELSKDELYERAKENQIDGRSGMTKSELLEALSRSQPHAGSRLGTFRRLAESAAAGEFLLTPRQLSGNDRRMHVRQTLREDHRARITAHSDGARAKFAKLAGSLFSFFRGTALLFYRDMAGDDAWMPTVLNLGDVHPGNFGVMPNADFVPIFAVNDFDEAFYAPFTWDLKRGATGFMLAAECIRGYSRKRQRKIARKFLRGYACGIRRFADERSEMDQEFRLDNAPELIRGLIENAQTTRDEWLREDYQDEHRRGFRSDEDLIPVSTRRDEFQQLVHDLVGTMEIDAPARAGAMRVKDVAIRKNQGTASLGLDRYYVMVEGPREDGTDDLILEFKRARRSALADLVPPSDRHFDVPGDRVKHAQSSQLVRGDVFYGSIEVDGQSFMTRERAPYRDDIDLDDLSKSEWKDYAGICGQALAHAHSLSDEIGAIEHDIEPRIIEAMQPVDLFVKDVLRFADEAVQRCRKDHRYFRSDYKDGAFERVDHVYQ